MKHVHGSTLSRKTIVEKQEVLGGRAKDCGGSIAENDSTEASQHIKDGASPLRCAANNHLGIPAMNNAAKRDEEIVNSTADHTDAAAIQAPSRQRRGDTMDDPDEMEYMMPMYSADNSFDFERDIQAVPFKVSKDRPVRIYCDGVYDLFHYGHARQLQQAKRLFPNVYLLVGVTNDESTLTLKGSTVMSAKERYESVRHCKYVDEVVEDAPWVVTEEFIKKYKIDYVAHDDIPYASADHEDVYADLKRSGRFIPTKRTANISTSSLITRLLRDYDKFLRRQILRGISREDLNISSFKESQVKIKEKLNVEIDVLKNELSEIFRRWERQSNLWLGNFIRRFETTKPGWLEKLVKFVKKRRITDEQS